MKCAVCLLLWEVNDTDLVAMFEGTAYCRRHLIQQTNRLGLMSDEQWVESVRLKYARGK